MMSSREGSADLAEPNGCTLGETMTKDHTLKLLAAAGVKEAAARELMETYSEERIRAVVRYCCQRYDYGPRGVLRALHEKWDISDEYDRGKVAELLNG